MTAEDARLITQRAIMVRYIKSIDELIYNAADRGEYTVEYIHRNNGYTREMDKFLADSLIEHYRKNRFKCKLKSKSTIVFCWNENKNEDEPEKPVEEEQKTKSPQLID